MSVGASTRVSVLVLCSLPVCLQSRPCRETPSWSWRAAPWPLSLPGTASWKPVSPCPRSPRKTGPARAWAALSVCNPPARGGVCFAGWPLILRDPPPPTPRPPGVWGTVARSRDRAGQVPGSGLGTGQSREGTQSEEGTQRGEQLSRCHPAQVSAQGLCSPLVRLPAGQPGVGMRPRALWDPPAPQEKPSVPAWGWILNAPLPPSLRRSRHLLLLSRGGSSGLPSARAQVSLAGALSPLP